MAFTLNEIRQLIRGALIESKGPQKRTGKVYITGTKGVDSAGNLALECEIRILQKEYQEIRTELIDTFRMFPLPGPPQIRGRGEGYVTFGGTYQTHKAKDDNRSPREIEFSEFLKAVETHPNLREWLRTNSPHHGAHNYGIFPTMTRLEWDEFVKFWREQGYSDEAGGWQDGTEYHSTYDKDNKCHHCEARFSIIRGTGDYNLTKTKPQINPRWKKQKISEGGLYPGSGGWCCGDPVRPATLFKKVETQAAYRPGAAGLRPRIWCDRCGVTVLPKEVGENQYRCPMCRDVLPMSTLDEIYLDSPGPKTKEWLQYENTEVALYVFDEYQDDVIKTIKERLDLPKTLAKSVYGEDDEYIKYKIPNRKYSKTTNVAPPDLHHYAYEAPQGVELQSGIWRIYNIEVDIQLSGEARWKEKHNALLTDYDDIPEDDIYARQQWDNSRDALLDEEDDEKGFLQLLSKQLSKQLQSQTGTKFGKVYAKPNGVPIPFVDVHGRHYTVRYLETGIKGLNFLIDPFMPYKKSDLARRKIDIPFSQLPHQYDESWGFFGRRDQILFDDVREWFASEFNLHLAPWRQNKPFPIDEDGNIYFIVEDEILVLDIDGSVDWGFLKEREQAEAQTVFLHKNDTLESLSKKFGVSVKELAEFNGLKPGEPISDNKILIPKTADPNYEIKQQYQKERQEELDAQLRNGEITPEQHKEYSEPEEIEQSPDPYFQRLGKIQPNKLQQQLKPSRPELRGSTIGHDVDAIDFKVIRNGCGIMRAISSIGDQIIKMNSKKFKNKSYDKRVEIAASALKSNLQLAAKELFELAKVCTKDSSGGTIYAEIIARSRVLGNKTDPDKNSPSFKPHIHRIDPAWIAWDDSAAYDTDLHIGLDEGKYWVSSRMSDRTIYRKANGGGSRDWYTLNIKRIRDVPFLPPVGKRIKCEDCKGKKETIEGRCEKCLGTGYKLVKGIDLVRDIVTKFRLVKNKGVAEPKDPEDELILRVLKGLDADEEDTSTKTTGRGRGWRKARKEHEADVGVARGLMRAEFLKLISDYDRSLIIPRNPDNPEERYVYRLDEETHTWHKVSYSGGRYGAIVKPKFTYTSANEEQPLGDTVPVSDLMFDLTELSQMDLLALHYNWLGAGRGPRQLQKVPFGDPTRNATIASFSDFWDNIMKLIRTGKYWGAQGFVDETEANDVSEIQSFLTRRIEEFFEQDLDEKLVKEFPSVFSGAEDGFQQWRNPSLIKRMARVLLKHQTASGSELDSEMRWPKKVVSWVAQQMLEAADVSLTPYSLIQIVSRILIVSNLRASLPTLMDTDESHLNPEELGEKEETVSPIPYTSFKYTQYYGKRFLQDEKDRAEGKLPKRTTPPPPTPEEVAVANEVDDVEEEVGFGDEPREGDEDSHRWGDIDDLDMENFDVDADDIPGMDDMDIDSCDIDDDLDFESEEEPEKQVAERASMETGLKNYYLMNFAMAHRVPIPNVSDFVDPEEAEGYISSSRHAALKKEAETEILKLKEMEEKLQAGEE
jgi:LysM repeat protein